MRLGDVPALRGKRVVAIELELQPGAGKTARGWIDDVALGELAQPKRSAPTDWGADHARARRPNSTFSRGNNFPATAVPHGFNFWTPVTDAGSHVLALPLEREERRATTGRACRRWR